MKYLPFNQNKLVQAMFGEDWPVVRNILENESHLIKTEDENGVTPLMRAVINNAPDDVLENMIETATVENLEHQNRVGFTILHFLVYYAARVSALRRVLQRTNTKINTQNKYGLTPLHCCLGYDSLDDGDDDLVVLPPPPSYEDHKDAAICLITFGASVSIKDKDGYTPLDLYDDNKCSGYEESTRSEKKVQLKELLERLSIPSEILARGTDAIKAFKDALKNGEITVVNSRLMFLGQEGSGKTSCVKAMLGKEFNKDEPSTDGIVTTTVFQTDGEDYSKWEEQEGVDEIERIKQVREHAIAAKVAKTITESPQNQSKSKYASLSESESDLTAAMYSSDNKGKASPSASSASAVGPRKKSSISRWFFRVFKESPGSGAVSANQPMANHPHMNKPLDKIREELVDNPVSQDTEVSTNQLNEMRKKVIGKLANKSPEPSDVTCIWDYAGQLEYYITHRFFLRDGSSYGVVFSLLDALDEFAKARDPQKGFLGMTNLQSILFWIRSIFEHAVLLHGSESKNVINGIIASPTISLIGTHKDLLTGSDSEKQAKIEDIFEKIFKEIKGTPYECHVDREMYAVDNNTALDEGIQRLKRNVGGYMKSMARTVPIKWVNLQAEVQEAGKTTLRMSLDEITKIATECGINKEDVIHVINYLNDIGVILHLPSNKKLRNTVITNVHMLIGMFMKIITVVKPNDVDKVPVMMKYWHILDEEGILAENLVRYFWRNELSSSEDKDAIFEDFIDLMKAFGLLFEKNESNEGGRLFVVPSRMKNKTDDRLEIKSDEKHTVSIYVTPKDFLPDAVYNILIVGFVNLSQDKGCRDDPKLFQNQSEIGFDERHYLRLGQISIDNKHSLKIEISRRTEKDGLGEDKPIRKPHPIVCMEVLHVIRQHLDEVYPSKKVVGYSLKILCSICSTSEKPHFQELENCLKYELMTCDKSSGNTAMSTADVQNLFVEDWYVVSERNNFHSVQFIIVDLGTEQMRMFFMKESRLGRKSDVGKFLIKEKKKNTALKDVDFEGQDSNVFSPDADIDKFDMTTLLLLVQYCFYPSKGESFWENPPADDNSELANLVRIYRYKRNFLDCSYSNRISDEEFDHRWKELTALFTGVGVPVENVKKYRNPWRRTGKLMDTDHNLFFEERANFSAINSLVYDVGTQQMRCFFLSQTKVKESDVGTFLIHERNKGRLKSVKFFEDEKKKLFRKKADINKFDITIMMKLIRHCCTWPSLNDFWVTPDESYFIKLANLVRIHQYRNNHLAHCPNTKMSNTKFDQDWRNLTDYLMKSGADSREIKICEKLHNAWTASVT